MDKSFDIALATLDVGSKMLGSISSNISNAETKGYKKIEAIAKADYSGLSPYDVGNGSYLASMSQDFTQGNIVQTDSNLDLALNGGGFFVNSRSIGSKDLLYNRGGSYKINKDNQVVNYSGNYLMGYKLDKDNKVTDFSAVDLEPVIVDSKIGSPKMTEKVALNINLPVLKEANTAKPLYEFDPDDIDTYNFSTSAIIYDSLGSRYTLRAYYLKPGLRANLINTRNNFVESGDKVIVDCSQVFASTQFDPTDESAYPEDPTDKYGIKNHTAWAVFYTIDGKPLQPLRDDLKDLQGFQYQAYNLDYFKDGKIP